MDYIIKKDEVESLADTIIESASDFKDQVGKFNYIIDQINIAWEGADALAYINLMREKFVVNMEELQKLVNDYGEYLRNVPDVYTAVDESFSSKGIEV